MNRQTVAIIAVLFSMTACRPTVGPSPTPSPAAGAISGRVIDATTGEPIVGANITTDPPTSPVTSSLDGSYSIAKAEVGTYAITASKGGYIDTTASVAVTASQTTTADLHLPLVPAATPTPTPTATPLPTATPTSLPRLSGSGGGVITFLHRFGGLGWPVELVMVNADASLSVSMKFPEETYNASFAWSWDGEHLALAGDAGDVYIMNANGTGMTTLTSTLPMEASAPSWSPNGTQISFVLGGDLYVMDLDSGGQRRLTSGIAIWDDYTPTWSPDGSKIVFCGLDNIYMVNAGSSGLKQLTRNPAQDMDPNWSPDGQKIAFVSNADIYVMNSDGSNQTNLTNSQDGDRYPDWSPDGRRIAFISRRTSDQGEYVSELRVINADGTGLVCLSSFSTRTEDQYEAPDWSPDGRQIAFIIVGFEATSDVYVVNSDGTHKRHICCNSDYPHILQVAWRPK